MSEPWMDLRLMTGADSRSQVFEEFEALALGEWFVLIGNRDLESLRDEFAGEHPGEFDWQDVERGPDQWRVRITKLASTALPRVLCDSRQIVTEATTAEASGAVWRLPMRRRDLDSNIIHLQSAAKIEGHSGPALDVLLHILDGDGQLVTELTTLALRPGMLVWLPRRSRREITAGADGLTYLTVHQRRPGLSIEAAPAAR